MRARGRSSGGSTSLHSSGKKSEIVLETSREMKQCINDMIDIQTYILA